MMPRPSTLPTCALCLLIGIFPAAGEIIKEIRIENVGAGKVDEAMVLSRCASKVGAELDHATVSSDVRSLLASGHFTDVRADAEAVPGGMVLTFQIRSKLKLVGPVNVSGAEGLGARRVQELLGLEPGDFVDDPTVAARVAIVKEEYRNRKYPFSEIEWTIDLVDKEKGLATVSVRIREGRRSSVRRIGFEGNKTISSGELRAAMGWPMRWNPVGWFRGREYDPDELAAGSERVSAAYKDRGFLEVQVAPPRVNEESPGHFAVVVPITEGTQYRIGQIELSGATLFPEGELRKLVVVKPGDIASASSLYRSCDAIRDYYESRGYMRTRVSPVLDVCEAEGGVNVRFAVSEGRLTYIHDVVIRGNALTRDKVIRRELLVYPGDVFDGVRIRTSESRLRNLGYFSRVESYEARTALTNESDLVFDVEEQRTGQFQVGAGFSSIDNLIGFVEVSQGNFDIHGWPFVGSGQKLKFRAEAGSRREDYTISFVEPWFLDRRLALGLELYSQERNQRDYDVERRGGAVSMGVGLGGPNRLDFRYRLEKVDIRDVQDTNEYVYVEDGVTNEFSFEEPARVSSGFTVGYSRDTRDNVFIPTRGTRVSIAGTVMGGPLGMDLDLYDLEAAGAIHFPLWFRHVLSLRSRFEVVDSYGRTEEVPISERLFLGGARTVRGFRYRWVGPKVVRADDPTIVRPSGGQSLAMANAEYAVPLVAMIRLTAFFDIGNVWYDAYDFDFGNLAAGTGVGIRFDVPGLPIRLDYAWPVERDDPRTRTEHWSFSLGYGF